jgi:hypothetical protein
VFRKTGWQIRVIETSLSTISQVKHFAYSQGESEYMVCLDNDILFTDPFTIQSIIDTLKNYQIAAVSPIAYDIDDEHPILKHDQHYFCEVIPDENGVSEGLTALGLCLGICRSDLKKVIKYWCLDFPYMEDQIIVHFLKKLKGYAHIHNHVIYHISLKEDPSYFFNNEEVINYLRKLSKNNREYLDILSLRIKNQDSCSFRKEVQRIG